MSTSPSYDAYEGDKNTALVVTVTWKGQPVRFKAGDTADFRLYQPDGKQISRAAEIVQTSPLVLRYRFLDAELIPGQWTFRPYLVWSSGGWEGYGQTQFFTVGRTT